MKKFDFSKFDLTQEEMFAISRSLSFYSRFGIEISVSDNPEDKDLTVNIKQVKVVDGAIFNRKELINRAKGLFVDALKKNKFYIHQQIFMPDISEVTPEWIGMKMKEYGLSRHDIEKQLCLDKSSISLLFTGSRKLNKSMKAAIYYYFMLYDLNQDRINKTSEVIAKSNEIIESLTSKK